MNLNNRKKVKIYFPSNLPTCCYSYLSNERKLFSKVVIISIPIFAVLITCKNTKKFEKKWSSHGNWRACFIKIKIGSYWRRKSCGAYSILGTRNIVRHGCIAYRKTWIILSITIVTSVKWITAMRWFLSLLTFMIDLLHSDY